MIHAPASPWCSASFLLATSLLATSLMAGLEIDARDHLDAARGDQGIQAAIDAAAEAGGGTVVLPAGDFTLNRYLFLRSNVTLRGQGEQTILRMAPLGSGNKVIGHEPGSAELRVEGSLEGLTPGMHLTVWRNGRRTHRVHSIIRRVAAVQDGTVMVDEPIARLRVAEGDVFITWGRITLLKEPAVAGERTIRVEHPELFRANQAFAISGEGDLWNHHFNAVEQIDGDLLTLERPLTISADAGTELRLDYSAITADGQSNLGIEDLRIEGCQLPYPPRSSGFYLSGVHLIRGENFRLRNVQVRHWNADGFSFQQGGTLHVEDCVAIANHGHGFHPGTGWRSGEFVQIVAEDNGSCGFYYCWHNREVNIRRSRFVNNASHGVGKLGHPGNVHNIVEDNLIEGNGNAGIQMNGGGATHNIIRRNIVRNNSRTRPGQWPGIVMTGAANGHVRHVLIEANTVESTLEAPTQWVGIEEQVIPRSQHAYRPGSDVNGHFLADYNRILNNQVRGHKTADILIRGANTVLEGNTGTVVFELFNEPDAQVAATAENPDPS